METYVLIKGKVEYKSQLLEINGQHIFVMTVKTRTRGKNYTYLPCVAKGELAVEASKRCKYQGKVYFKGDFTMFQEKQQIKVVEFFEHTSISESFLNEAHVNLKVIAEPKHSQLDFFNVITTIFSLLDRPFRSYLNIWDRNIDEFIEVKKEDVLIVNGYIRNHTKKKYTLELIGETKLSHVS